MDAGSSSPPGGLSPVSRTAYDGQSDDLLTGGLGWDGLRRNQPPTVSPVPTAAELRRLAIHTNYRALVDTSEGGGFGSLFGPNVAPSGEIDSSPGAGRIAGVEVLAFCPDETGRPAATMMVQVPSTFDARRPALLVVPSPGGRGVYGGIAAGEWGLKRGFAVAYTDKGTGLGAHELMTDTVLGIDGLTATAAAAGRSSHFTTELTPAERDAFNAAYPHRYAFKYAHSRRNPETDWGRFVLRAVEFAFHVLNELLEAELRGAGARSSPFTPENTRVIGFSVSNGGGAVLAAAEQDAGNLLHAVVAIEPQVSLRVPDGLRIRRGGREISGLGRPLYDFMTLANLLQPCAAHAACCAGSPLLALVDRDAAEKRASQLAAAGLLSGATFPEQADDALKRLHDAGWEPESNLLHASHHGGEATSAVAVTVSNAYARASVTENLCGFSFATMTEDRPDGRPGVVVPSPLTTLFGAGSGIPPTPLLRAIHVVYNDAAGGPIDHRGGDGDGSLQGALRLRALWSSAGPAGERLRRGVDEVRLTGNLRGKPALIVHGRSDALLPVNHTSRPYFGRNQLAEGEGSRLSYIEVLNAQHFDTFLGQVPGYAEHWLPLHYYAQQAMDLMWSHLETGTPLPSSQVVRTQARGRGAPPVSVHAHLPPIAERPADGDAIRFDRATRTVEVPD